MASSSSSCWTVKLWLLLALGVSASRADNKQVREVVRRESRHALGRRDGRGLSYAQSCASDLRAYTSSSVAYFEANQVTSTFYYTGTETIVSHLPGSTASIRLVTLCDGYPRVVGHPFQTEGPATTSTTTWTNTNPTYILTEPFPEPTPTCSIGNNDCALLSSSYSVAVDNYFFSSQFGFTSPTDYPPCTTSTLNITYSSASNGNICSACNIVGHSIRLLYWPVTTVQDSGNLCGKAAETITPSVTAPRTFVTDNITITSPTVGVSISGLSRVDGCGPTVDETILLIRPEEVTSVRGARALFDHRPFNFTDLNYKCLDDPDKTFFSDEGRDDCYQEVPADAYWEGYANWAGLGGRQLPNATIWGYQPQVLVPNTLTEQVQSMWGGDCFFDPDGIWDPPRALTEENSPAMPTLSRHVNQPPASALPGGFSPTQAHQTSHLPAATALPDGISETGELSTEGRSSSTSSSRNHPARPSPDNLPPGSDGHWGSSSISLSSSSPDPWPQEASKSIVDPSKTVIYLQSTIITVGATQVTIGDQPVSAGTDGLVWGDGQSATTIPYASHSSVIGTDDPIISSTGLVSEAVPPVEATTQSGSPSPSAAHSPQAQTVGSEVLTLATISGSPYLLNEHTSLALIPQQSQAVTFGTQTYEVSSDTSVGIILKGPDTTVQWSGSGSAMSTASEIPSITSGSSGHASTIGGDRSSGLASTTGSDRSSGDTITTGGDHSLGDTITTGGDRSLGDTITTGGDRSLSDTITTGTTASSTSLSSSSSIFSSPSSSSPSSSSSSSSTAAAADTSNGNAAVSQSASSPSAPAGTNSGERVHRAGQLQWMAGVAMGAVILMY